MIWPFTPRDRIRSTRALSRAQRKTLFGWGENLFGGDHLGLTWGHEVDRHFLVRHEGRWVGHVGLRVIPIRVGARDVTVSGIGGLMTLPHVRGLGLGRQLVEETVRFSGVHTRAEHMLLFCLDPLVPYYAGMGFEPLTAEVTIAQPRGPVAMPLNTLYRALRGEPWPEGPVRIDALPW